MGVPTTNIKLYADVAAAQLGLSGVNIKITDVYATSYLAGAVSAGSYHNISIGASGTTPDYYANKIFQPYNTGANMLLGNWGDYDHQHNNVVSFQIQNNSQNDYQIDFYISDTPASFQYLFWSATVNGGGSNVNNQNYDTGINAYNFTGTPATPYFIDCSIRLAAGPAPMAFMLIGGASDGDAVGAGQARRDYTNNGPGPYQLEPAGAPFSDNLISGTGAFKSTGIPWNKRTTWDMTIN